MNEMVSTSRHSLEEMRHISKGASEQHAAMEEISASSESLSRMAAELQELVAKFKLS